MKKEYLLLACIVIVAAFIRFWHLGATPPSPDWDEAALGYNAFSILHTGKDEYGVRFPLSLRSFDDYKPPLYMYLTIPSIALFGLEVWAVRLPSAVMGTLTVLGAFALVYELFSELETKKRTRLALLVSALLALSPWHIQFSRIAFEANIGLSSTVWAMYFFLKGRQHGKLLSLSAVCFGLSLYAYHSQRIFAPLLVLLTAWWCKDILWQRKKDVVIAMIVGCIVVAPLVPVLLDKTTLTRLRGTSALSDQTGLLARSVRKLEQSYSQKNPIGILFDNRRIVWIQKLTEGYLSHYSVRWLFVTGDNPRHHAPGMGLLYLWELPFVLIGFYFLSKSKGKSKYIVLSWFFIAPIAASPTTELPHAIRTLVFLPTFQIFTAYGILAAYEILKKQKREVLFGVIALPVVLFNIGYYAHMYYVHMDHEFSPFWQYGYKQAVDYAKEHYDSYDKIIVSTKLEQPHMFFLFYLKYPPEKYLAAGGTMSGGFKEYRNAFDKFYFRPIHWDTEEKNMRILYIGTPDEIPDSGDYQIHYLDGQPAIEIKQG